VSKLSYKSLLIIFCFLLIGVVVLAKFVLPKQVIKATWWNDGWHYRQAINISSHTSSESNVYITASINIDTTTKAQTDDGDFRFISQSGDSLSYYVVSGVGTTNITFHILIPSFTSGASTIYTYYNNTTIDDGFSTSDFSTEASNYTIGSLSSEEVGGGPIAYWKFDEGVGSTAYDSTSNKLNANLVNPKWQAGISGNAFDGSSGGSISIPDNNLLDISNNLTISFWYYPRSTHTNYANHPVTKWSGTADANFVFYEFGNGGSGNTYMWYANRGGTWGNISNTWTPPSLNSWYFITLTYNSSIGGQMYINSKPIGGKVGSGSLAINTASLSLLGNTSSSKPSIDEFKIYPYARTAAQIKLDYNSRGSSSGSSVNLGNKNTNIYPKDGLLGYWTLENDGSDSSGNGFNATTDTSTHISAKIGKGSQFTTAGETISIPHNTNLETADLSVSFWLRLNNLNQITPIISKRNASSQTYFTVLVDTAGRFIIDKGGYAYRVTSSSAVNINTWQNFTITIKYGTPGKIKIYKNGTLFQEFDKETALLSVNTPLLIGDDLYSGTYYLDGIIDEVVLYNRVLSENEVQQIYNPTFDTDSLNSKLIAYYKFDEGNGTIINNSGVGGSTLNSTFGTGNSAPTWTNDGKFGKALNFDGTNDYISIPDTNNIFDTNYITITGWLYKNNSASGHHTVLSRSGNSFIINFYDNNFETYFFTSGGTCHSSAISFTSYLNSWHYFAASYDGQNSKIYIDGKLINTISTCSGTINPSTSAIYIGSRTLTNYFLNTKIDEVKIYNTALTDDEIKQDYNQGSAIQFGSSTQNIGGTTTSLDYCIPGDTSYCASPVAEWKMDERTGTSIKDTSGNNNTGNINGANWTTGKIGAGLKFSTTNDYIYIPTLNNFSGSGTINMWVKWTGSGFDYLFDQNEHNFLAFIDDNGIRFFPNYGADSNDSLIVSNILWDQNWHFITITADDSTNLLQIYFDGILKGSSSPDWSAATVNNFTIGAISSYRASYNFNGSIDQVKIYNYARTPAQVAWDYNKGAPVGWWKLDECQDNIANDSSGFGNNGTINIGSGGSQNSLGTCQIGTSAAWTNGANGKFNSSLSFDGSDDYMTAPISVDGSEATVSFWVKNPAAGAGNYLFRSNANIRTYIQITGNNIGFVKGNPAKGIAGGTINTSIWNHILLKWWTENGTTYALSYINGEPNNSGIGTSFLDNTQGTYISVAAFTNTGVNYTSGQFDDVRVYNYALTDTQIKTLYNNGAVSFQ